MSPVDPHGSTDPRGWDRPARPWPDRDPEAGSRGRGAVTPDLEPGSGGRGPAVTPDRYADPHNRPPADAGGAYPGSGYDDRGTGPYRVPFETDDPAYPGRPGPVNGRDGRNGRAGGEPEYPTEQLEPVRDDPGPESSDTREPEPVRDEPPAPAAEPPRGRRRPGRRRAGGATGRPASSGRAGRNLPAAIAVGVALGALIVVPLLLYPPAFLLVIAGAVGVGSWEMARAVGRVDAHPPLVPLVAGGVLMVGLAWFAGPDGLTLGLVVTVLGSLVWRLGDGLTGFRRDVAAGILIAAYVPFLGGFAALLAAPPDDGSLRVLVTLVAVVLSDTGGYAAGANFGRHPMAPTISPKKSWEGLAGSIGAAALGSALLIWLLFDVPPWWGALFGVAVSAAAVLGDLAESMVKRDLGVKDMSDLLPGHGGLMDRLDSVLFAVPAAYLLLAVFVPMAG
ncbi:phosphatidate cytidylyltransferase [Micromonospora sp. WMMA1363]|uniref:phosphatidate cytidylyltransferase n=1 Tax=Micromonospora sp. WMMA1363 TaxID=3053985 RepID=UPI00259CC894|nr:phosphatidate cytidylyltransferase [Micromonospora sp. WMMA1363]MDM4723050.1 phosphatidate cytidylyltransferase [Micromonospora sp. WMMA1363]